MSPSLKKLLAVVGVSGAVLVVSGVVLGGHDKELAAKAESFDLPDDRLDAPLFAANDEAMDAGKPAPSLNDAGPSTLDGPKAEAAPAAKPAASKAAAHGKKAAKGKAAKHKKVKRKLAKKKGKGKKTAHRKHKSLKNAQTAQNPV